MTVPVTSIARVRLVRVDNPRIVLESDLGPELPQQTAGTGGWNEIPRPRKVSVTEWGGVTPLKASLQVMFDGYTIDHPATDWINRLTADFCPDGRAMREPPAFRVLGAWPISGTLAWVNNGVTWNDYERRLSDGAMLRVVITLDLIQLVGGDVAIRSTTPTKQWESSHKPSSASAPKPSARQPRYHTVRSGETLSRIAQTELGNWRRWTEIASLNHLRDPNKLTVGQRLRLP